MSKSRIGPLISSFKNIVVSPISYLGAFDVGITLELLILTFILTKMSMRTILANGIAPGILGLAHICLTLCMEPIGR